MGSINDRSQGNGTSTTPFKYVGEVRDPMYAMLTAAIQPLSDEDARRALVHLCGENRAVLAALENARAQVLAERAAREAAERQLAAVGIQLAEERRQHKNLRDMAQWAISAVRRIVRSLRNPALAWVTAGVEDALAELDETTKDHEKW